MAQLNNIQRQKQQTPPPYFMWPAIVFIGLLIPVVYISVNPAPTRDVCAFYAPMAEVFAQGNWNLSFVCEVPALVSFLAGFFCMAGLHSSLAVAIVSSAFYFLTIFPLWGICRRFVGAFWAQIGCLLYLAVPVLVKNSVNGQIDSGKVFFVTWSVYLLLKMMKANRWTDYIQLGIALAGLSLVRGEGIILAMLFYGWCIVLSFLPKRTASPRYTALYCFVTLAILLILIAPRMYQVFKVTGIAALEYRQVQYIEKQYSKLQNIFAPAPRLIATSEKPTIHLPSSPIQLPLLKNPPFRFSIATLVDNFFRGSFELYIPLFLLGLGWYCYQNKRINLQTILILSIVIANTVIFSIICLAHRFFLVNIILLMPYLLWALRKIYLRSRRYFKESQIRFISSALLLLFLLGCFVDIGQHIADNYNDLYYRNALVIKKQIQEFSTRDVLCFGDVRFAYWLNVKWGGNGGSYQDICRYANTSPKHAIILLVLRDKKEKVLLDQLNNSQLFCRIPNISGKGVSAFRYNSGEK